MAASTCPASRDEIDELVDLAHSEPRQARSILARHPELSLEPSHWGENCVQAASHLGHTTLLLEMLAWDVPLDLFAECALGMHDKAIAALCSSRVELEGVHGLPILHFAVVSRKVQTVKALIAAGATLNPQACSLPPLHTAIACREIDIVCTLLEAGADPAAVGVFGDTALDWAIDLDGKRSPFVAVLTAPR